MMRTVKVLAPIREITAMHFITFGLENFKHFELLNTVIPNYFN